MHLRNSKNISWKFELSTLVLLNLKKKMLPKVQYLVKNGLYNVGDN
jgi:hypothetical protein